MERRLGNYTLRINVHPNYPVRDILVDVTIHETRAISLLQVVKVPGGEDFFSAVSEWREGSKTARLKFDPDPGELPEKIPLHGQLVIQYDVERSLDAGDVQIEEGYFVHFFAPVDLQHTPKHITFLIDTSGSMLGTKLNQVKDALKRILVDLNKGDEFSIVQFDTSANRLTAARYSTLAVKRAHKLINNLQADGGTNIDGGLKVALTSQRSPPRTSSPHWCADGSRQSDRKNAVWPPETLSFNERGSDEVMSQIVVLLTDGQATEGVINPNEILKNARERNKYGASIFCLGFGENADMDLLLKLALQNGGHSRKIYEDYDAADQLKNFYESLSTPLLLDINFSYSNQSVNLQSLTSSQFNNYFMGTELVISGQLSGQKVKGIRANITGRGRNGEFTLGVNDWNTVLPPDHHLLDHLHLAPTPKNFMERLWAFLMIKDLLNQEKAAIQKSVRASARGKALYLALHYQFVTPLTSLVVVQPNSQRCKEYDDDYDYEEYENELSEDVSGDDLADISATGTVATDSEGGKEIQDESLDSDSKRSYDLSPKIYNQNELGSIHPDDRLLEEIQRKTYSAFSNSGERWHSAKLSSIFIIQCCFNLILSFLTHRVFLLPVTTTTT